VSDRYYISESDLRGLAADPIGKYLIPVAVVMQIVGFITMRRIVDIKV